MVVSRVVPNTLSLSLADILGESYVDAVCRAKAVLSDQKLEDIQQWAHKKVSFDPESLQTMQKKLLARVGSAVIDSTQLASERGAGTSAINNASALHASPLSASGHFRVGEDGRLYLVAKSEHYQASLGHAYPGFELTQIAHQLGIPNPTHNNTRGHITRLLERELVRITNGVEREDQESIDSILGSSDPRVLNRVINLSTGSLAVEAALKLALSRFYRADAQGLQPEHEGLQPVFLVMGDDEGNPLGNYHGTTILTQLMRGMWPALKEGMAKQGLFSVRAIRPNRREDLDRAFSECTRDKWRIAAFFHEIVMMNYGARLLDHSFLEHAYALCREYGVPTIVDEIQTGLWSPQLLMFKEYGLKPSMVALGKGFPGGECAASRLVFSAAYDNLAQFGALVTNGQEELSSLAYLISIRAAESISSRTEDAGDYYSRSLHTLAGKYPRAIRTIEGRRHLCGISFHDLSLAKNFVGRLNALGIDVSVQTYKDDCAPVVLTKLPITADEAVVDFLLVKMTEVLEQIHAPDNGGRKD